MREFVRVEKRDLALDLAWVGDRGTLTRDQVEARDRMRHELADQELRPFPDPETPLPMILTCPGCGERHIDKGEFATKPHHTHACQGCGMVWRPAIVPTVGVQFLPGFKD